MPGQLSLFKSRRQRGTAPPAPLEVELHRQTADILRRWKNPGWKATHFPAGEKRHVITATNLKRMGLEKGWPDFILLSPYPPCVYFLELKRRGEALTDAQLEFQCFCVFNRYQHKVADNLDDVIAILHRWGAVRISVGVT